MMTEQSVTEMRRRGALTATLLLSLSKTGHSDICRNGMKRYRRCGNNLDGDTGDDDIDDRGDGDDDNVGHD